MIVATRLDNDAADAPAFEEMLDQVIENCGTAPGQVLADAGYFSGDNVKAAATRDIDPLIATGRLRHGEEVPAAPHQHSEWLESSAPRPARPLMPGAR